MQYCTWISLSARAALSCRAGRHKKGQKKGRRDTEQRKPSQNKEEIQENKEAGPEWET